MTRIINPIQRKPSAVVQGLRRRAQRGVMLLEALIAILIFSVGILAVVGMQAVAIKDVAQSKYRSDASFLADSLLSQMWTDAGNIAGYAYAGSGTAPSKLTDWVRDDYSNPDRLFLMGVLLHFEGDARGRECFEAAMRMKRTGDVSHIVAFIGQPAEANPDAAPMPAVPKLNDKPMPIDAPQPVLNVPAKKAFGPIPGAPVPMPDL